MGQYRKKIDIIADILLVAARNARKTQIMYKANLSYQSLQRYLSQLVGASLVEFENETKSFALTDKGLEYLNVYQRYAEANKNVEDQMKEVYSAKKLLKQLFRE